MFNHARTLLLNESADKPAPDWALADEPVPSDFHTVPLPSSLMQVRRCIFGSTPDRMMLNYRLAQLLPLLHLPRVEKYTLAFDKRITYRPDMPADLTDATLSTLTVEGDIPLTVQLTDPTPIDATGHTHFEVQLLKQTDGVLVTQLAPHYIGGVSVPLTMVNQLSTEQVALGGSGYSARISDVANDVLWLFVVTRRPHEGPGNILTRLTTLGEPTLLALFGTAGIEPYLTFRELFNTHPEPPYRLAGALLALVWRTEELR